MPYSVVVESSCSDDDLSIGPFHHTSLFALNNKSMLVENAARSMRGSESS